MSTATYQAPICQGVVMNQPSARLEDTRSDLQEIISDLLALKMMARDGIQTHHSQRELVKHLNAKELAAVARGVSLAEKRSQPIYNRPDNLNNPSGK
ncbi:MAG: hypothetical protein ACYDDS_19010 [Candidatus Sulfotelmatobacter sp.]